MRRIGLLLAIAVFAAGCSSSSRSSERGPMVTGTAAGYMHIIGGPLKPGRVHDQPLSGRVQVQAIGPDDQIIYQQITVGGSGRFRVTLPVGRFLMRGSTTVTGDNIIESEQFAIVAGRTTHVDLVSYVP